jgi:hypothetical protein
MSSGGGEDMEVRESVEDVDGMWIRKGNKGMNMIQVHYLHV